MAVSKPKLLQTLPLLISVIAILFLMPANKVHSQDTTSFAFDYFPVEPDPNELIYQADAWVPEVSTISLFLRLTETDDSGKPMKDSVGRVLYSPPVQFWDQERQLSFETSIRFFITPSDNNPSAEGIAFFIAPVNSAIPGDSSGGNLGIFGSSSPPTYSVFAVEFDTYANEWDPSFPHIGIDINSLISANVTRFDNMLNQEEVTARIYYDGPTGKISVLAGTQSSPIFRVTYDFDLKTILPQRVQVGISSSTGQQVAVHDIRSWHFKATLEGDIENEYKNQNNSENEDTYIQQYV